MILAQTVGALDIVIILAYLFGVAYLGWLGYKRTQTAADYLVAGRKAHPVIMALSYGATFISTSAIVGFGGVAGMFGMSLLWLTFANIFVGIFIAFVFLAPRVRSIGHRLDAHTFPELLGRRYQSRFIQVFSGLVIFLFIPLYAAAVMIGGTEFISTHFGIDYRVALLVFSLIVAAYVIAGGLKAVMYTDALQGAIMFVGMGVLLVWAYTALGGVESAHKQLSAMASEPTLFRSIGHQGWMKMPQFGWGSDKYNLWWIVVSTIVMGVGIGVLAQPQLSVRFMTVKSKRELNRAVLVGGVFILMMTGVAFTVGAVSNVYFRNNEAIVGKIVATTEKVGVIAKEERDLVKKVPCQLLHIDTNGDGEADVHVVGKGYDVVAPDGKMLLPGSKLMPAAQVTAKADGLVEVRPNANAFTRSVIQRNDKQWMFNSDSIIPIYISSAMPKWFGLLFLLTLLAAAMSTLSSQFHASGSSLGYDVYGTLTGKRGGIGVTRLAIVVGLILAVLLGLNARGGYIIARATSIFFGLCASAFLPALIGGLFFKRMTKAGATASIVVGFLVTSFWLLFIKDQEARAVGLCKAIFGRHSLLETASNWPVVDPIVIALPISAIVAIVVSMLTRPPAEGHLRTCFE